MTSQIGHADGSLWAGCPNDIYCKGVLKIQCKMHVSLAKQMKSRFGRTMNRITKFFTTEFLLIFVLYCASLMNRITFARNAVLKQNRSNW